MAIAYAIAGLGKWVEGGGVLDKAEIESEQMAFPELVGLIVHGLNGETVLPLLALALLVVSFFTKLPGAVKWAGLVLLLVIAQVMLGFLLHELPALGALHGLNALLLSPPPSTPPAAPGASPRSRRPRTNHASRLRSEGGQDGSGTAGASPSRRRVRGHRPHAGFAGLAVAGQSAAGGVLRHGHGVRQRRRPPRPSWAVQPATNRSERLLVDRLQDGHRDRPARASGVLRDLGCLREYDVVPHRVTLVTDQLAGLDPQMPGPQLYLGQFRRAQVAEPVRVAPGSRAGTPDHETVRRLEVAHTRCARETGSSARCRDHQDVDALAPAGQPRVQGAVHPHTDSVTHPSQLVLQVAHRTRLPLIASTAGSPMARPPRPRGPSAEESPRAL